MQGLLTLGFGLALGIFWLIGKGYRSGESPFERLPPGVTGAPSATRTETVADGTRYVVSDYPVGKDGRSYHVAEVKGTRSWVAFWLDPVTGKRTLWMALSPEGDLADLRKDWAL